jgi:hypothetical protein
MIVIQFNLILKCISSARRRILGKERKAVNMKVQIVIVTVIITVMKVSVH